MRTLRLLALVLGLAWATTVAASAADGLRLVEAGNARFPDRSYILTLPRGASLKIGQLHVSENGSPVHGLSLLAADAAQKRQFAVVLVIDASNSMKGRPIESALAAARALAARRNAHQQLAIVTFNGDVRVALPFTTDSAAISAALKSAPRLAEGTRIYDGLQTALDVLARANVASGSIVLLSDGADVGSTTSAQTVLDRLGRRHVRVFTVGLASGTFDRAALGKVADGSHGSYAEASTPKALEPIFADLGYMLSREYLLSYRSLAGPKARIAVTAKVDGYAGGVRTQYVTPALSLSSAAPYTRSLGDRIVRSPLVMLLVAVAIAGILGLGVRSVARPRPGSLVERMSAFVSLGRNARPTQTETEPVRSGSLFEWTDASLARASWWARLRTNLELAKIGMSPQQVVLYTAVATVLTFVLFVAILGPWGFVFGLLVPLGVRGLIRRKVARVRKAFSEQLPDNLEVLASALRAGHSLVGALSVVVESASEPSRQEFQRVVAEEQLGVDLEDALHVVVVRMGSRDLDQVALVARLQRQTGSNSAEVLDRVVETIRSRMELRRLVQTLTAQGRLSRWILTGIPIGLAAVLSLLNPGYLNPLFSTSSGHVLIVVAVLMVTAGSLIIGKIVDIKV